MISLETFRKIQKHKEYGASVLKTSQKMDLAYQTVYKWWNRTEEEFLSIEKTHEFILDNYRQFLLEQICVTPQINNTTLLKRLKTSFPDFSVPPATFFRYIKALREQTGYVKSPRAFMMRAETAPGYEAQVDYGQYAMKTMYGNNIRVYFFCMILSYSRMKFVYFSNEPFDAKATIEAHRYAFRYFGGRPQMLLYDQDHCIIINENFGDVIFVKSFEEYVKETGFTVYLCRKHDPQTKGKVEKAVDSIKREFLDGRVYCGIDLLNAQALEWLDRDGNGQVNIYTKKSPRELFRSEYGKLQKVYEPTDRDVAVLNVRCGTNVVEYRGNYYALPEHAMAGTDRVRVEKHGDFLLFYHVTTNDAICKHRIAEGQGNVVALPTETKELSIEEELREEYRDDPCALDFLSRMRKQAPRYVYPQCSRIRRLQKYYSAEQLDLAFTHCLQVGNCSVSELMSFLLCRFGEEIPRKLTNAHTLRHYKDRAEMIRKEQFHG